MTAKKPKLDPAKLRPTSARDRMVVEPPVQVVRKPDASSDSDDDREPRAAEK